MESLFLMPSSMEQFTMGPLFLMPSSMEQSLLLRGGESVEVLDELEEAYRSTAVLRGVESIKSSFEALKFFSVQVVFGRRRAVSGAMATGRRLIPHRFKSSPAWRRTVRSSPAWRRTVESSPAWRRTVKPSSAIIGGEQSSLSVEVHIGGKPCKLHIDGKPD